MRSLIWKELREQRLWGLLLVVCNLGVAGMSGGYLIVGSIESFSSSVWLPIILAFILGTNSYKSELSGAADFVHTRAVTWKRILAAKVSVGLMIIMLSAVSGVAAYRLLRPEHYADFTTLPHLLVGLAYALLFFGIAYVMGLACSVVWPGVQGGVMVLLSALLLIAAHIHIYETIHFGKAPYNLLVIYFPWLFKLTYAYKYAIPSWFFAGLVGFVFTIRYGVTLTIWARTRRYFSLLIATAVLAFLLCNLLPLQECVYSKQILPVRIVSISPDGQYLVVYQQHLKQSTRPVLSLVKITDSENVLVDNLPTLPTARGYPDVFEWLNTDMAMYIMCDQLFIMSIRPDGSVKHNSIELGEEFSRYGTELLPSPDGRFSILGRQIEKLPGYGYMYPENLLFRERLLFADIENERTFELVIPATQRRWWQSNTEIGYIDAKGNRHIVNLLDY